MKRRGQIPKSSKAAFEQMTTTSRPRTIEVGIRDHKIHERFKLRRETMTAEISTRREKDKVVLVETLLREKRNGSAENTVVSHESSNNETHLDTINNPEDTKYDD